MKKGFFLVLFATLCTYSNAAKVDTLYITSKSMNKRIPNVVITPDSYKSPNQKFPVMYLLHGAYSDFAYWVHASPELLTFADRYNMMIVCPDGDTTSWYFDSPVDKTMRYETYVTKELVGFIDSAYHTRANKEGRAITGLSMGGHGALYLTFRHQDIWGACGSICGGVDFRPFPNRWEIAKWLGPYATNADNWEKNTVINLLYLLDNSAPKIIFDCGIDDFFYDGNKRLHQEMLQRKIPHDYTERPGKHDEKYWTNAIKYHVVFFNEFFQQKPKP